MTTLIQIGDVAVTPKGHENPYKTAGNPFHIGENRAAALGLFRKHLNANVGLQLWFAPTSGGARHIRAEEVDWERSGVKVHACICPECRYGVVVTAMKEARDDSGLGQYEVQRCEQCARWSDNYIAAKLVTLWLAMPLQNERA